MSTIPQIARATGKSKWRRYELWIIRFILLVPAVVFTIVGLRFLADPAHAAAAAGITFDSALGLTNLRSGVGGLFLGAACITLFCLLSPRRFLSGLGFTATLMGVVLGVRLVSVVVDGTVQGSLPVLCAEGVCLVLSLLGIFLETRRQPQIAGHSQGA
jgi:hypothetical protein